MLSATEELIMWYADEFQWYTLMRVSSVKYPALDIKSVFGIFQDYRVQSVTPTFHSNNAIWKTKNITLLTGSLLDR